MISWQLFPAFSATPPPDPLLLHPQVSHSELVLDFSSEWCQSPSAPQVFHSSVIFLCWPLTQTMPNAAFIPYHCVERSYSQRGVSPFCTGRPSGLCINYLRKQIPFFLYHVEYLSLNPKSRATATMLLPLNTCFLGTVAWARSFLHTQNCNCFITLDLYQSGPSHCWASKEELSSPGSPLADSGLQILGERNCTMC